MYLVIEFFSVYSNYPSLNNNMDLVAETVTETFSKRLDLNTAEPDQFEEANDKFEGEEEQLNTDYVENDFIETAHTKIPAVCNETRASLDRTKPSDMSYKLITEDSMILDESQLINVKSARLSEACKPVNPVANARNSSTEDLSSSSVCMSSASNAEVSRLVAELAELREREKVHLKRIDSLEVENEKFKAVAIDFEEIFKNLIQEKEECEVCSV